MFFNQPEFNLWEIGCKYFAIWRFYPKIYMYWSSIKVCSNLHKIVHKLKSKLSLLESFIWDSFYDLFFQHKIYTFNPILNISEEAIKRGFNR